MPTSPSSSAESGAGSALSFLWLEITGRCNLECGHCYAESGPSRPLRGALSTPDWLATLGEAAALGCRAVQFIGGEPTLHPDLSRMIAFARSAGYEHVEVYTNATIVREELLAAFATHDVLIAFSFYSDDPAVHDAITRRRGSFGRTVAGIERMVSAGLRLRAGIVETDRNPGHGPRARRLLAQLGVPDGRIDEQRGIGRGALTCMPADLLGELCGECRHGTLCVTPSGQAHPCIFSRFAVLGDVREGLGTVAAGRPLAEFRDALNRRMLRRDRGAATVDAIQPGCDPLACSPGIPFCIPRAPAPWRRPPCEPKSDAAHSHIRLMHST